MECRVCQACRVVHGAFVLRNVYFSYDDEGPMILRDINCKIGLTSRVGIVGANGAGGR